MVTSRFARALVGSVKPATTQQQVQKGTPSLTLRISVPNRTWAAAAEILIKAGADLENGHGNKRWRKHW